MNPTICVAGISRPMTDAEYTAWQAQQASRPPPALATIKADQLRAVLLLHDIPWAKVDAAIAAIPDAKTRALAQAKWEFATVFDRNHPITLAMVVELGLDDKQADAMWQEASTL